jgi:hypothetical protein
MPSRSASPLELVSSNAKPIRVAQHGTTMPIPDWARFLRCLICGEREVDFVVSGAAR